MSSFVEMIENITPDIYESLKLAVEIGKWSDGRKLTQEQRELSLQALIAWEVQNLPKTSGSVTWAHRNAPPNPRPYLTSCSSRMPSIDRDWSRRSQQNVSTP